MGDNMTVRLISDRVFIRRIFAAAALTFAAMTVNPAIQAYAEEIAVSWNNVSLTSDGDCSFSMAYNGTLTVDRYELKFARKKDGTWNENYKTVKTSGNDTYYDMSFSSTGQYYYIVRALFVGGDKSTWSDSSNDVSVSSGDIDHDHGGPGSGSGAYIPVYDANGNILYYVPAGPGTSYNGSTYTSTTIGPGGQTTTTTYNSNGTIASNVNGTTATANNGQISTNSNNAQSGWIRVNNHWMYKYVNGTYPKNTWDRIEDKWYFFDANGYLCYGWVQYNGNWYYADVNTGRMMTGFNMVNGKWYYMNESGIMQKGYVVIDGKTYYFDQNGARVDSSYNPDGHQFDVNGVMIK